MGTGTIRAQMAAEILRIMLCVRAQDAYCITNMITHAVCLLMLLIALDFDAFSFLGEKDVNTSSRPKKALS